MFPPDAFLVFAAWLVVGLLLVGTGNLIRIVTGSPDQGADGIFRSFWTGWACLLFMLSFWNLFLPGKASAFGFTAVVGLAGLIIGIPAAWKAVFAGGVPKHIPALVLLAVYAACLSNLALGGPRHGDTGAYFLAAAGWAGAYPAVPGLANLSVLLGFNHASFLYGAWLDTGPLKGHWFHVANGMLILALVAQCLLGVSRLVLWRRSCQPKDLFFALMLPAAVMPGFGIFLTSPSPDLPIFILGIILTGELISFTSTQSRDDSRFALLTIMLIAASGVMVKPSFGGLAAAAIFVALAAWLWRNRAQRRLALGTALWAAVIIALFLTPWIIRSAILTGFPLYPSSVFPLPVDWQVQVDWASWSKQSMQFYYETLYKDPRYAIAHLKSLGWGGTGVTVPLAIALVATVLGSLALALRLVRRRPSKRQLSLLVLIPLIASFTYVFATAPMARYFGAFFWLLAVLAMMLALGGAVYEPGRRVARLLLALAIISAALAAIYPDRIMLKESRGFAAVPRVPLKEVQLESGLSVLVPVSGCSCWAAPLSCTPVPNQALRLRKVGELGSGFMIDPSLEWVRHPEADSRCQMGEPRTRPDE